MEPTSDAAPDRRSRRRRAPLIVAAAFALLAAPMVVLAGHQFSDVPDDNPYHDAISQLVESGITLGCGSGNYCPGSAVSRGQMAAFLTRGLGFSAADAGEITFAQASSQYAAVVSLPPGTATGGTAYVAVGAEASVVDFMGLGGCPCGVVMGLQNVDSGALSPETVFTVTDPVGGTAANTGSAHWVFEVPSGGEATFGVYVDVFPFGEAGDPPEGSILGAITAEYSPFGSTGDFEPVTLDTQVPSWAGERSHEIRKP